jgi:hypothetical protein
MKEGQPGGIPVSSCIFLDPVSLTGIVYHDLPRNGFPSEAFYMQFLLHRMPGNIYRRWSLDGKIRLSESSGSSVT